MNTRKELDLRSELSDLKHRYRMVCGALVWCILAVSTLVVYLHYRSEARTECLGRSTDAWRRLIGTGGSQ